MQPINVTSRLQRKCSPAAGVVLACLAFAAAVQAAPPLTLRTRNWTVEIDPATLRAQACKQDGRRIDISLPVLSEAQVSGVEAAGAEAHWRLMDRQMEVRAGLSGEGFRLAFRMPRTGSVTWPSVGEEPGLEAWLLPKDEGYYIPAGEEPWREFLTRESPMPVMSGLSMPMFAVRYPDLTVAYILENPFDNELAWERAGAGIRARVTHRFQRNQIGREYSVLVRFGGHSPIECSLLFRDWFARHYRFTSYLDKIRALPDAEKLLGAAHIYLWANSVLATDDVTDWPAVVRLLATARPGTPEQRVFSALGNEAQQEIRRASGQKYVALYQKRAVLAALATVEFGKDAGIVETVLGRYLRPKEQRGSAVSPNMMRRLHEAGFDRLWLGAPGREIALARHSPETVKLAREYGFLFGPYDSYHSIHSPSERDTWETAQFDQELYDKGGILNEDGSMSRGFQRKGFHLSTVAAKPYVVQRVESILRDAAFNSWFVDCDATGELFDNYSPAFPQTQGQDMQLRLDRMAWLIDEKRLVVGSEGGAWFAAPVIHFAHGMETTLYGWKDPELRDPKSRYFLGKYGPPEAPAMFFKPAEVGEKYRLPYYDPRYRLPLYQAAFHDAIITSSHWSIPAPKLSNVVRVRELLEILYGVPPMYHLNRESFSDIVAAIKPHYAFFSPLHREVGTMPLTAFEWLTRDRLVQRTVFGGKIELVANFGAAAFTDRNGTIPAGSVRVRRPGAAPSFYTPPVEGGVSGSK